MDIGKLIKKLRLECNWSQCELARRSGITSAAISTIEKGNRNLSLGVAKAIALALNISLDELAGIKKILNKAKNEKIFIRRFKKIGDLSKLDQNIICILVSRLLIKK